MKITLFILLSLSIASVDPKPDISSSLQNISDILKSHGAGDAIKKFHDFIKRHQKKYDHAAQTVQNFKNYVENLKVVDKLNEAAKGLAKFGENQFSDIHWNDFKKRMIGKPLRGNLTKSEPLARSGTVTALPKPPPRIDWREKKIIGPVPNQGQCGSCWTFATVGVVQAQAAKAGLGTHDYAEQQLAECLDLGCGGGYLENSFKYVQLHGLPFETDYPYNIPKIMSKPRPCRNNTVSKIKFDRQFLIVSNETVMAAQVADGGPIAASITVGPSLQHYKSGILVNRDCENTNSWHAVMIVGYGEEKGQKYWIIRNSWGTTWGESGFFRVPRGVNWCHINYSPRAGIINKKTVSG